MCIEKQCLELQQKYPYLLLRKKGEGYILSGTVFIENGDIKDQYEIEISIPNDYPKKIPTVKEIGAKIPKGFHHYSNETLCFETPFRVHQIFRQCETLLNFVDNLVVYYLFSYSYYAKHGKLPFGEHLHGAEGILEDYKKEFGVSEDSVAIRLLKILVEDNYRGHHICPCGSGKNIRDCHGQNILSIKTMKYNFINDFGLILVWLKKTKNFNIVPFISKKVKKIIEKIKDYSNQNGVLKQGF
ncbi:MAG: hypothetical protein H8E13_20585 [Actinobacteria bacterium]|nr:hypothetical protein [Actinomycetota bacterium]MBL7197279.1 hypothetical protein [Candidatus Omnitrophota bacterium]